MTPISGRPTHIWSGLIEGITRMCRSIHMPERMIRLNTASHSGLFLVNMFISPRNGSTNTNVNTVNASGRHGSSKRRNTHQVSSGRFAYQITRYCDQNW